mgnify:CR=1 FL=1
MALTAVELLRLDQIMNQPYRLTGGSLVDDILEISKLLQKDFRRGEPGSFAARSGLSQVAELTRHHR